VGNLLIKKGKFMIIGLTHNIEGLIPNMIIKYGGKISTGFMPNEPPNNNNYPKPAGYFRMLKEVTNTKRVGSGTVVTRDWILNKDIQDALEKSNNNNKTPRRIEIVCLYKSIDEMWDSSLSMFSSSDGLICKSHGNGTEAKYLTFDNGGNRKWISREFDGKKGCLYKECPDFKSKACKQQGMFKCFPTVDLSPNPYRFETRSINSIMGIESSLLQLYELLKVAYLVKKREASKEFPFDGFFGLKLFMVHKKIKSGGKDVFITEISPTPECISLIMDPIKRGIEFNAKHSNVINTSESFSLIGNVEEELFGLTNMTDIDGSDDDVESGKNSAIEFGADADKIIGNDELPANKIKKENKSSINEAVKLLSGELEKKNT
jgi:hypothetical protein